MLDQPTNPEYTGSGCEQCGNGNENGDIYMCDVEYDGDENGVSVQIIWLCERCDNRWSE